MGNLKKFSTLLIVIFVALAPAFAKPKPPAEHAPLPSVVLTATKLFIQNDSGYAETADGVYGLLKKWGKYQIVTTKQDAELVLVLTTIVEQRGGSEVTSASSYNYKSGAWTSGTTTIPTTDTYHFTQITLIDASTGDMAWQDRRIWWRKHHPLEELINALRQRVEEQVTQSPQ